MKEEQDVYSILGLKESPFLEDHKSGSKKSILSKTPLQTKEFKEKLVQLQDLHLENQAMKDTCTRLNKTQEELMELFKECKQLRLKEKDKKDYSQAFLKRLTKDQIAKEAQLAQMKARIKCSHNNEHKLLEMKNKHLLYKQLFGVEVCPKYSSNDNVTLKIQNLSLAESTGECSDAKNIEKENEHILIKNNPRKAWLMLEKRSKLKRNSILSLKNSLDQRSK